MVELILAGLAVAMTVLVTAVPLARWPQADPVLWGLLGLAGMIVGTAGLVHVADARAPIDRLAIALPWAEGGVEGRIELRLHLDGLAAIGCAGVGLSVLAAALVGLGWGRHAVGDRRLRPTGAALPLAALAATGGMLAPLAADIWTLGGGTVVAMLAIFAAGPLGMAAEDGTDRPPGARTILTGSGADSAFGPAECWEPLRADPRRQIAVLSALLGALAVGGIAGALVAAGGPTFIGFADFGRDFDLIRNGVPPIEPEATVPAALAAIMGLAGIPVALIAGGRRAAPALGLLGAALGIGLTAILGVRLLVDLLGPSMLPRQLAAIGALMMAAGAGLGLWAGLRALRTDRLGGLTGWSRGVAVGAITAAIGLALLLRGQGATAAALETTVAALLAGATFGLAQGVASACAGMIAGTVGSDRFSRLGGVLEHVPAAGSGLIVAAAAGLGLPLLGGFVPIWLVVQGGVAAMTLPDAWMRLLTLVAGGVMAAGWLALVLAWLRGIGLGCLGPARSDWPVEPADAEGPARLAIAGGTGALLLVGLVPALAMGLAVPVVADLLGTQTRAAAGLTGWLGAGTAAGSGYLASVGLIAVAVLAGAATVHTVWRLQLKRPIRLDLRSDAPWMDGRTVAVAVDESEPAWEPRALVLAGRPPWPLPREETARQTGETPVAAPGLAVGVHPSAWRPLRPYRDRAGSTDRPSEAPSGRLVRPAKPAAPTRIAAGPAETAADNAAAATRLNDNPSAADAPPTVEPGDAHPKRPLTGSDDAGEEAETKPPTRRRGGLTGTETPIEDDPSDAGKTGSRRRRKAELLQVDPLKPQAGGQPPRDTAAAAKPTGEAPQSAPAAAEQPLKVGTGGRR